MELALTIVYYTIMTWFGSILLRDTILTDKVRKSLPSRATAILAPIEFALDLPKNMAKKAARAIASAFMNASKRANDAVSTTVNRMLGVSVIMVLACLALGLWQHYADTTDKAIAHLNRTFPLGIPMLIYCTAAGIFCSMLGAVPGFDWRVSVIGVILLANSASHVWSNARQYDPIRDRTTCA